MMICFVKDEILEKIGYTYILESLPIISPYGKEYLKSLVPFTNKEKLEKEYDLIQFFREKLTNSFEIEIILKKLKNILPTILRCEQGLILNVVELYEIKMQALQMKQLKKVLSKYNVFDIYDTERIITLLSDAGKTTYDFYLYESYSNKLKEYRIKKREIEKEIALALDNEKDKLLIERAKIVSLEEDEEKQIRTYLSNELKKEMVKFKQNIKVIGHIDLLIAKTKLANKYQARRPFISDNKILFRGMFHPLIKEKVEEKKLTYTKNDIELILGATILTGANMSGKSTILKTLALNVYLAQLGFYVFAEEAFLPLIEGIRFLGYEKSNTHGYSTFGQEIISLNEVINDMKKYKLLICVDEFARTTNPKEGEKFVSALINYVKSCSSYTIVATHYDIEVDNDINHYQIKGLKDYEKLNKDDVLANFNRYMDYTLMKVNFKMEVPKEAYRVSQLLNIDEDFLRILDEYYKE